MMLLPEIELAKTSSDVLRTIRDGLIDALGQEEYDRRVDRYIDLLGEMQAITGAHLLDAARELSQDSLKLRRPWSASFALAAALELGGAH